MTDTAARLRPLVESDLELVRAWRNAPEVRRHMFTTHEIGVDEHRRWFDKARADPARRLLVFEWAGQPTGFVHFVDVQVGGVTEWGFYAAPEAPRGTGRKMGHAALDVAFRTERVHKICGRAIAGNAASIRFHLSLGFREEGVLREHHRDGSCYHDIHCFGLLHHEWRAPASNSEP